MQIFLKQCMIKNLNKLNERLLQIEKDKTMEINLEKEAERKLQEVETEKNKIIDELKFTIKKQIV